MSRRRLPWLVSVPLMVAGSLTAHGLSYRIVAPNSSTRHALLHDTGHAYLEQLPLVAGVLAALALAGLVLRATSHRFGHGRLAPALAFLLPIAAFAVQEHLERFVHDGSFPLGAAIEPTFLIGMALQLPFALAAYAVALVLLEVADRVADRLGSSQRPAGLRPVLAPSERPIAIDTPRFPVVSLGYGMRGPPLTA